ncbi:hypothetical protein [Phocaeicola faecalis]
MNKEKLITLWNGKDWKVESYGVYFIGQYDNHDIQINFTDYSENDVLSLSDSFWSKLSSKLKDLDQQARDIIQNESPDEDASELVLTDITFDKSGCYSTFALGYETEDSQEGELYLLIKFNDNFEPDKEVIYETY